MKELWAKIKGIKRNTLIKNSFLLPILAVVVISLSHVVAWYGLGNPMSWAIYLSVAIEVFALASVSASSIKMKKGSIWLLFGIVTTIQIIGNIFFTYEHTNILDPKFLSWVELISPWFEDWNLIDHKRFLAYIQGGTLPFMSLIALHFYIKFNDNLKEEIESSEKKVDDEVIEAIGNIEELKEDFGIKEEEITEKLTEIVEDAISEDIKIEEVIENDEIMIPDVSVKNALRNEQQKQESNDNNTNIDNTEKETKEVISPVVSEDKIVTKVVQKEAKPEPKPNGQIRGHRKNPVVNPQILPGTN